MDYNTKVVLVTGGANGIGKAIVEAYCKEGAKVIFADKDEAAGKEFERELKDRCYDAFFYKIDLKEADEILEMMKYIKEKFKMLHVVINNAGISKYKNIFELTLEEWDEVMDVNLRSVFIIAREFAKYNKECIYGRIVNISSTRFCMSEPNWDVYAASKGGVVSLTHSLSVSLSDTHITVNCISPGWIENKEYRELRKIDHEQHPSKRVGKPEDIARTCLFLTDERNDFINGQNIIVDGGMTKKMIYI